jgi:hypothetical protein
MVANFTHFYLHLKLMQVTQKVAKLTYKVAKKPGNKINFTKTSLAAYT